MICYAAIRHPELKRTTGFTVNKPLSFILLLGILLPGVSLGNNTLAGFDGQNTYPSTYQPAASAPLILRNATVLTGNGVRLDAADVAIRDGRIEAVGVNLPNPDGHSEIDASGRWITPGIIDIHSHLGVYPSPGTASHADGNEITGPATPGVWAEHGVWPQDPGFAAARAGGVTSLLVLPGSANLFGGRGVVLKNVASVSYQGMKFPNAPHSMKMACGENPKRVYGSKGQAPMTRMGNMAGYRSQWIKAQQYLQEWQDHHNSDDADAKPPQRDLAMETLAGVLRGEILVQMHCYRADEMLTILDLAEEFDYRVTAFHHAVEAYKIADELAEAGVCAAMWADWWGFKMEAYDGIQENIALVDRADNSCAIVHSDSAEGIQRLNQEAAKAMARGNRVGLDISPAEAIRWITLNAAQAMGIAEQTGSLEPGKNADLVVWNQNPFSVYALTQQVYIDGALVHDHNDPQQQALSDFLLGQPAIKEQE
jgi:imidazolonepropionase-like amidohydrolase